MDFIANQPIGSAAICMVFLSMQDGGLTLTPQVRKIDRTALSGVNAPDLFVLMAELSYGIPPRAIGAAFGMDPEVRRWVSMQAKMMRNTLLQHKIGGHTYETYRGLALITMDGADPFTDWIADIQQEALA